MFWKGFGIIVWKGRAQCKRAAGLPLWEMDTSKGPFLQQSFGRFFIPGWTSFWRGLSHAINCQGTLKDQTRHLPFRQLKWRRWMDKWVSPFTALFPPKYKWLHYTAPPRLQKQAEKTGKRSLGGVVRRVAATVSVTCHNLPGSAKPSATTPVMPLLPSPGSSCEEDWELFASGLPNQAVLVTVSQKGWSLLFLCCWEFLGTMFYGYWTHWKYTRSALEQSRDTATAFQVLTTSSVVSPGVTHDTVFYKVRKNK